MISISYVMCMIYVTMLFVNVAHGPVGLLRNKLLTYLLTICGGPVKVHDSLIKAQDKTIQDNIYFEQTI